MEKKKVNDRIRQAVRERYGQLATQEMTDESCCSPGCCKVDVVDLAEHEYADEERGEVLSLGCGNPTAIADLQPAETVLDLGSGAGLDCFLAAEKAGKKGRVIGIDMTPKMLDLARKNARQRGVQNVEFHYGYLEDIPLPDASVDVIISNCVINLSADKDAVFHEAMRVLKPGGRLYISDVVSYGELPLLIRQQMNMWAGCISGALDEQVYLRMIVAAGFEPPTVTKREFYTKEMLSGNEEIVRVLRERGLSPEALDKKMASITLKALKA